MKNLAGSTEAVDVIKEELSAAGITARNHYLMPKQSEVTTEVGGFVHGFYFHRNWYYWVVQGSMPLHLAQEMYHECGTIGRRQIRVAGHCGCPPPEHYCETIGGTSFVKVYHIDSLEGLQLFVHYAKLAEAFNNNRRFVPYEIYSTLEKQQNHAKSLWSIKSNKDDWCWTGNGWSPEESEAQWLDYMTIRIVGETLFAAQRLDKRDYRYHQRNPADD